MLHEVTAPDPGVGVPLASLPARCGIALGRPKRIPEQRVIWRLTCW
jgi:hypothetical protein